MSPNRPNIVFIMADQMKATASHLWSEHGVETPSLARLASKGVLFENAITPHPLCVPARTSVMTSRYPHSTGCRRNETMMPSGEPHAFRIWKEAGYSTGLIGKNHCFVEPDDLALFDVRLEISHRGLPGTSYLGENLGVVGMEWVVGEDVINRSHETRRNMPRQSPALSYAVTDHPIEGYSTEAITRQTEAYFELASHGRLPGGDGFCLWVSYPDPHEPYEVPQRYADMVPADSVRLPPQRTDEFSDGTAPERNRVLHSIMSTVGDSEEHRREALAAYLASTRFVDDGVGRILDALDRTGLRENTIVVFTADHGDFAGEHDMMVKGGVFYDCLVRVPLIASWPSGGVPQGVREASPVNTVDILPTLLQLQGIADFIATPADPGLGRLPEVGPRVPEEMGSERINSETLRRFQGTPLPVVTPATPREAAFSEYGTGGPLFTMAMLEQLTPPHGYPRLIDTLWAREAEGRRKMVRTRRWKYVTDPMAGTGEDELYDFANDPWELRNVAADPTNTAVISDMRRRLFEWMAATEDPEPVLLPRTIGRDPSSPIPKN